MADIQFEPGQLYPCDIVLFAGKSFISRGIKLFSGSKWSHTALFLGSGYVIEATQAGVEKNLLAPLVKKADRIAVLRIFNLTVENTELMKAKAYSLLGDKYDFLNLVTLAPYFILRKLGINAPFLVGSKAGEVICSELVAQCAMAIPIKFAKNPKLVSPETIYRSDRVTKVLEVA